MILLLQKLFAKKLVASVGADHTLNSNDLYDNQPPWKMETEPYGNQTIHDS